VQLQQYFEYVASVWLSFAPGGYKLQFPRDFKFPVTVPYSFIGDLPPELKWPPRLEISIELHDFKDKGFNK
jgi:hypothetical protein